MLVKFLYELVKFFQMLPNSNLAFNGRFELQIFSENAEAGKETRFLGTQIDVKRTFDGSWQILASLMRNVLGIWQNFKQALQKKIEKRFPGLLHGLC